MSHYTTDGLFIQGLRNAVLYIMGFLYGLLSSVGS